MRLWSLHLSLLDQKGLVALWREALLAQKVLQGKTKGYRSHPQLHRFRQSQKPVTTISAYLWAVHDEATNRGYSFDSSKITRKRTPRKLAVTQGQLDFELGHLKAKLRQRDPRRYREIRRVREITVHPLFIVVAGEIEAWERARATNRMFRCSFAASHHRHSSVLSSKNRPSSPSPMRRSVPLPIRHRSATLWTTHVLSSGLVGLHSSPPRTPFAGGSNFALAGSNHVGRKLLSSQSKWLASWLALAVCGP